MPERDIVIDIRPRRETNGVGLSFTIRNTGKDTLKNIDLGLYSITGEGQGLEKTGHISKLRGGDEKNLEFKDIPLGRKFYLAVTGYKKDSTHYRESPGKLRKLNKLL